MHEDNFSENDFNAVELHNSIHDRIKVTPMYFNLGFSPVPNVFARQAVLGRLIKALEILPKECGFIIWDVYRPRTVQEKLFLWMRGEIKKNQPHLTEEQNYHETSKYMSPPSAIGEDYCPPHLSGGAVDLTLYDTTSQMECDMGTAFDDCSEKAHSDFFQKKINLSDDELKIKAKRDLLRNTLECVGFTSYKYEWWHFDIGDIFWGKIVNKPQIFGPLFGDAEWPIDLEEK